MAQGRPLTSSDGPQGGEGSLYLIGIPAEVYEKLTKLAAQRGMTVADAMSIALNRFVKEEGK